MDQDKDIVARYIDEHADTDADDIPEIRINEFGTLSMHNQSNPDEDLFTLSEERKFGLKGNIKDTIQEGGISLRRSKQTFVNLGGARKLQIRSDPPELLTSSHSFPEVNSTFNSPDLTGSSNGYYFSHWEVNGIRQAAPNGKGLSKISYTMDQDKDIVARYIDEHADTDADDIPDWYELHEFGTLSMHNQSNPDGDSFTLSEERKFGLKGNIKDTIQEGGISLTKIETNIRQPRRCQKIANPQRPT